MAKKTSSKPAPKKPSKLASIKDALFGGKKKPEAKAKAAAAKAAAAKAAPAKAAAAKAVPAKAAAVKAAAVKAVPAKSVVVKNGGGKGAIAKNGAGRQEKAAPAAMKNGKKAGGKEAPATQAKAAAQPAPVPETKKGGSKGKTIAGAALKVAKSGVSRVPAVDAEAVCREVACEGLATSGGYCRLHYIKNWKKIKRKEIILKEGKLNQYIEELVAKYPDKYIEAIRQDLASDKDFAKVIYDLDLDESVDDFDVEGENVDSLIDSIKRDFDDEGDASF